MVVCVETLINAYYHPTISKFDYVSNPNEGVLTFREMRNIPPELGSSSFEFRLQYNENPDDLVHLSI